MFNFTTKLATAAIAVAAASAFATPAIAGQCPTPGSMDLANAPTMPKGVTDMVISSVDLGPEIGVDGRQLRTRRLVVQPGGIVPLHSHKDRPALIYTLSGSITEYSTACGVADRAQGRRHQPRSRWPQPLLGQPRQGADRPAFVGRVPRQVSSPSRRPPLPPPAIRRPASPRAGRHPLPRSGYD